MKTKRNLNKVKISIIGTMLFFVTIALTVTCAVMIYSFISTRLSKGAIAGVMFAVIVVLSLLCTLIDYLRRKYTVERPVEKILDATERIAKGDFNVRIQPFHAYDKYDDYDRIIDNLNMMAAELEKTDTLSNDFIANVSHEIKTPLAIIRNYAAALKDEKLDATKRLEYIETLITASKRLTNLITNILKLNKMENQEILPERKIIDLGELVRECVIASEDAIEDKGLNLECDIDDISIVSDASFIEIVVNNLLSNAIKFTESGGAIKVSVRETGSGKVALKVVDTGVGMPPDIGRNIFNKFYQGDSSRSSEGNGLGLALVKKVIDTLGGEISVESKVGVGSTFTVIFAKGVR